jgi:hypothetical protein
MNLPHSLSLESETNSAYKEAYLRGLQDWRNATKEQAMAFYRSSPEYGRIPEYIRFLENDSLDPRRPSYRSQYKNNKMGLARRDRKTRLTDSRPVIDVSSSVMAYEDSAAAIEGVIRAEWNRQNMASEYAEVYDMASLYGTAFWKIGAARNKLTVTALGPDQVIPIQPSRKSIQDAAAIAHLSTKSIQYIKTVYPHSSAGIDRRSVFGAKDDNRPHNIDQTTWENMQPGLRRLIGGEGSSPTSKHGQFYGIAELEQYYVDDRSRNESSKTILMKDPFLPVDAHNWWYEVKPGELLYPRKRLITFAAGQLVYDGPSPYFHGMYPYACLRINPVPWAWHGLSIYRDLLPMQKTLNEIPAGVVDIIRKAINPQIIANQRDVSPSMFQQFAADKPGARFLLNPGAEADRAFIYQKPPELPGYVFQQLQALSGEFDRQAGSVDTSALTGKNQVPSGDTVDQMRDNLQTSLRLEERYLESFLNDSGTQTVSNVIQFYDASMRLKMLGADGVTDQDFLLDPGKLHPGKNSGLPKEYFWKMFGFRVVPGSTHSGARDRAKLEAVELYARGMISLRESYRMMGWDSERAERVMAEKAEEAAMLAGPGMGEPPMGGGAGGTRTPRPPQSKNDGVSG